MRPASDIAPSNRTSFVGARPSPLQNSLGCGGLHVMWPGTPAGDYYRVVFDSLHKPVKMFREALDFFTLAV
jgi:hypothetical protein